MPRDMEQIVFASYPTKTAKIIIKNFPLYFCPRWSGTSVRQFKNMLKKVVSYLEENGTI